MLKHAHIVYVAYIIVIILCTCALDSHNSSHGSELLLAKFWLRTIITVFTQSDATATVYFVLQFVQLLFDSGDYSRAAFILLSQSLRWRRREWSSIEWLLDREENLLVIADWFTSLFWVYFVSSWRVFACACATQVFVTLTVANIQERHLFRSACMEVQLLFESSY